MDSVIQFATQRAMADPPLPTQLYIDMIGCGPLLDGAQGYSLESDRGRREEFRKKYSYAVPNVNAIAAISEFIGADSALEIGAGRGLWAYLLQCNGINITPTDLVGTASKNSYEPLTSGKSFTDIVLCDGMDAVRTYSNCNVIMFVWPPYHKSMASDALHLFTGNKLVYVGESVDGCTGDEAFHGMLARDWVEQDMITLDTWEGLWDRLYLFTRKGSAKT